MAISKDELMKIKSNKSSNRVERIGRVTLTGLYAKFAGNRLVYDEYANGDRVNFTFYWTNENMKQFVDAMMKNKSIDKQQGKEFSDALFKYSKTTGEPLIYATKRTLLPEVVTYDESSKYSIIVDLMHAQGTDESGKNFDKNYVVVRNVLPDMKGHEYLTFTDAEITQVLAQVSDGTSEVKQIQN